MGIFSFFGKKKSRSESGLISNEPTDKSHSARPTSHAAANATTPAKITSDAQKRLAAQAIAEATALKIDAIESEMSSEFVRPVTVVAPPSAVHTAAASTPAAIVVVNSDSAVIANTGTDTHIDTVLPAPVEATLEELSLFEQVAILFADSQFEMVEHLLQDAIADDLAKATHAMAWSMLFDLQQIRGNQAEFERLSIIFANRFEMSPPAWKPFITEDDAIEMSQSSASVAAVIFTGKLNTSITKPLEKLKTLLAKHAVIRLDFSRVNGVDISGCDLLLPALVSIRKAKVAVVCIGAAELAAQIKSILAIGRRDETETPWLLLMELLALAGDQHAFEEISIDYCVTFEVSPPDFAASKYLNAPNVMVKDVESLETQPVFKMPGVIQGHADTLITALTGFIMKHDPARLDCSNLARVDVNAASQLLSSFTPLAQSGRSIELIQVNHFVAALFEVLGFQKAARVSLRKSSA